MNDQTQPTKTIERKIIETITYKNERAMRKDMNFKQNVLGWEVIDTDRTPQGFAPVKTIALGVLFLPLALFGKNKDVLTVTYKHGLTGIQAIFEANKKKAGLK